MKILTRHIALVIALTLAAIPLNSLAADDNARAERNYIKAGNALFREKKYDEAATEYQKAMRANPNSEIAKYNWALSILKQEGSVIEGDNDNIQSNIKGQAYSELERLAESSSNEQLVENSLMTLGNNDFFQQNYAKAIDRYKNILRKNPGNDEARNNLYLAQKMLKDQQQNQDQNKDQNKDKNKDQNKDQNDDKDKNQNKDQNKDKDKDKDQDQNKDKDQNKDQNKDKDQNNQQPQPSGTEPQQISPERAEQMLKAIEDKENETRRRVDKEKRQAGPRQSTKPW